MRDKNRIPFILKAIENIWSQMPDMRLGQLLLNVLRDPALYYIEDEDLVKVLDEAYNPHQEKRN